MLRQASVSDVNYSTTVRVETKIDNCGYFIMTSEDLPGLFLASKNYLALMYDVPRAIKILYKDNYCMDVTVVDSSKLDANECYGNNIEDIRNPLIFSLNDHYERVNTWQ